MELMYNSITYGRLTELEVFEKIKEEILIKDEKELQIVVGTDSQTYARMKVVPVSL